MIYPVGSDVRELPYDGRSGETRLDLLINIPAVPKCRKTKQQTNIYVFCLWSRI